VDVVDARQRLVVVRTDSAKLDRVVVRLRSDLLDRDLEALGRGDLFGVEAVEERLHAFEHRLHLRRLGQHLFAAGHAGAHIAFAQRAEHGLDARVDAPVVHEFVGHDVISFEVRRRGHRLKSTMALLNASGLSILAAWPASGSPLSTRSGSSSPCSRWAMRNGVSFSPTTTIDGTLMSGSELIDAGVLLGEHAARGSGEAHRVLVRGGGAFGAAGL